MRLARCFKQPGTRNHENADLQVAPRSDKSACRTTYIGLRLFSLRHGHHIGSRLHLFCVMHQVGQLQRCLFKPSLEQTRQRGEQRQSGLLYYRVGPARRLSELAWS